MAFVGTSGKPIPFAVQVVPPFPETYTCEVPKPPKTIHTLSSLLGLISKSITNLSGNVPLIFVQLVPPLVDLKRLGGVLTYKLFTSLSYCANGEVETYSLFSFTGETAIAMAVLC